MTHHDQVRLQHGMLCLILLLAFGLRLYRLGAESLWYDETVSLHLASKSLPALVAHTAGDIHPPGYYLILHVWIRLAGRSEFSAAFLSLFFGLLLVALAYRLAVWIFDREAAWLSALLVAISPYHLWYSQEVRMYTLGAVLGVGVLVAVLSLWPTEEEDPVRSLSLGTRRMRLEPGWILYTVCGALGLWTLYYFAFLLIAVNLMVGLGWMIDRGHRIWRKGWLRWWVLVQIGVLVLYAPWLPIAWHQATEPPVPPWREFTSLDALLGETWSALSLGQSALPAGCGPALILFLVLFVSGLFYRQGNRGMRSRLPWFLAGFLLLPVLLIYLASWITPLYHIRYVFPYSTPFYLLVGAGLASWPRLIRSRPWRRVGRWGQRLALAGILIFSGTSLYRYHTDPNLASDDHRAAVQFLADRWRPGDAILVNAGYVYPALLTYWRGDPIAWRGRLGGEYGPAMGRGPVILQTGSLDGSPSLGWGDPNSDFYAVSPAQTAEALTQVFADFDRVWVYRLYDTVTDPSGFIRHWLDEHGIPFEEQTFTGEGQLRVQGFLTRRPPLSSKELEPVEAALRDGSLQLAAYSSLPAKVKVGGNLDVALVWRVLSPPDKEAILFAGLFDEAGERWAQTDERPLGSLYPVDQWPEGALVRTPLRVSVPAGTPLGSYRLEVGWYRFVDGQPVWIPWGSEERQVLGSVQVVAPKDWWALPLPEGIHRLPITIGPEMRLIGFEMPRLVGRPSEALPLTLFWQALANRPGSGPVVIQLTDDDGQVLAESSSAPLEGRVLLAELEAGQVLRDPRLVIVPNGLAPGVYSVRVGRRSAAGDWFPIRHGPFRLGSTYPLATVHVLGRAPIQKPPIVQHPLDVRLGDSISRFGLYHEATGERLPVVDRHGEVVGNSLVLAHLAEGHFTFGGKGRSSIEAAE
ncbi:MAG: glycosyltransferase family 39 protein [Anaerolineae bacterium]